MRRYGSFFLLFLIWFRAPQLMGQNESERVLRDVMELWAEQHEEESIPDDWIERMQAFLDEPINLNDTTQDALMELPMLDDFKISVLRAYIAQNGPLASVSELYLMNDFDSLTINRMRPFVVARPVEDKDMSIGEMLRGGHGNLRWGTKTVLPYSRGYKDDIYKGDPFRLFFRYLYRYGNRIAFQFSGDKDAGESFRFGPNDTIGMPQHGFDYYGYYLMLNNFGVIKNAVFGKYQMQFGQGSTLWSGFAPWLSSNMSLRRYGQGIRPASAFCEYGYLRGVAATVALPTACRRSEMELTLFYSNVDRDATFQMDSASTIQYQSFYESGYHRTELEMMKKEQLNEQLFGGHLEYRWGKLVLGGTSYATWLSSPIEPPNYVYNTFAFKGDRNFNAGIDATYRYRRILLFGEVSMADNGAVRSMNELSGFLPMAAVAGFQFLPDSYNQISVAAHYGSPSYQNLHANIVGQGGGVQNKMGILLFFKTQLPYYIEVRMLSDLYRYPWLRYRAYSPSAGSDCRLWLSKELTSNTTLELLYRHQANQRNSDAQLYYVENTRRQQFRMSLFYHSGAWQLTSRVMLSWFDCDDHMPQQGFLLFQEAAYNALFLDRTMTVAGHMSIFDISDYDARLYNYETDLLYEMTVPMLTGRGIRSGILFCCDITSALSLAFKYAVSIYPEAESLGSGYDRVDGAIRHEIKMQMRLKF